MKKRSFPLPLAKMALMAAPPLLVARTTEIVVQRIRRRHPKLFANLARLSEAVVIFAPTDTPYRFALTLGQAPVTFSVLTPHEQCQADATITGSLQDLIAMMEGQADGDTLFFSRAIQVVGDTSVIVGLRNTLDREEIDLMAEILSLFGPFAKSAGFFLSLADTLGSRLYERMKRVHETSVS
ncbi:MAG: SCP2 sterol-binding domain-containing protein [Bdellovibrionales bacterium]|jgi:predicted lipid carrier protein YhbT